MFNHSNGLSSRWWWSFMVDHNRSIFHLWRNISAQMDTYQRIGSYILCYAVPRAEPSRAVSCYAFYLFLWLFSCTRWSFTVFVILHMCSSHRRYKLCHLLFHSKRTKMPCGGEEGGGQRWFFLIYVNIRLICVCETVYVRARDRQRPTDRKNITLISTFKRFPYHYTELHYVIKLFVTNIFDECPLLKKKITIHIDFDGIFLRAAYAA